MHPVTAQHTVKEVTKYKPRSLRNAVLALVSRARPPVRGSGARDYRLSVRVLPRQRKSDR